MVCPCLSCGSLPPPPPRAPPSVVLQGLAARALAGRLQAGLEAYNRHATEEMDALLEVQRNLMGRERQLQGVVSRDREGGGQGTECREQGAGVWCRLQCCGWWVVVSEHVCCIVCGGGMRGC